MGFHEFEGEEVGEKEWVLPEHVQFAKRLLDWGIELRVGQRQVQVAEGLLQGAIVRLERSCLQFDRLLLGVPPFT